MSDACVMQGRAPTPLVPPAGVTPARERYTPSRRYIAQPAMKRAAPHRSRSVKLPGMPGSIEFMDTYLAALATVAPPPPSAKHVIRGSLAEVTAGYFRSAAFANLSDSSQKCYRS